MHPIILTTKIIKRMHTAPQTVSDPITTLVNHLSDRPNTLFNLNDIDDRLLVFEVIEAGLGTAVAGLTELDPLAPAAVSCGAFGKANNGPGAPDPNGIDTLRGVLAALDDATEAALIAAKRLGRATTAAVELDTVSVVRLLLVLDSAGDAGTGQGGSGAGGGTTALLVDADAKRSGAGRSRGGDGGEDVAAAGDTGGLTVWVFVGVDAVGLVGLAVAGGDGGEEVLTGNRATRSVAGSYLLLRLAARLLLGSMASETVTRRTGVVVIATLKIPISFYPCF
ncbi:hypothetical protein ABW21_db0203417 [Orbilia brochopaga]|nr:hypothetical protein ABW21_db0203417 [Drechslerella brochopaga]